MTKNSRPAKISEETHEKAFQLSLELSEIEGRRVPMKEVLGRPFSSPEIIERMKLGSKERKEGTR